jgi:hypothetical protein
MKKFTLFIMMLVMCATTTFAQTAITSTEDVKAGKIYWFLNYWLESFNANYPSTLLYPADQNDEAKKSIYSSYYWGVQNNMEDPNQQFALIEYNDAYYLYSVGADNFVSMKNNGLILANIPATTAAIISHPDYTEGAEDLYPFAITVGTEGRLVADYPVTGYDKTGYVYCFSNTPGNYSVNATSWQVYEVGELANYEELKARLATAMTEGKKQIEEACDNLMYKVEEAEEFFSDINYSATGGGQIQLQVEDPYSGNYIWCNEPETSEGPIEQLIDGVVEDGNFFHSCWNGTSEPQHWLQVDLENAIQNFSFTYYTRVFAGGNDFPDAIEVQGSNDGSTFETIAVLDNDLPQQSGKKYDSGNIYADKAYKHLRFVITAERIYFHMSEFVLNEAAYVSVDEAYQPYVNYLNELAEILATAREFWEAHDDASATLDEYNAHINAINELLTLVKNLVSGADDEKTVEYVAYLEEEIMSKTGVGYPEEAPRAAFQALIDAAKAKPTAQARLDLQEALKDYIKTEDIILPTGGEKYTLTFVTYSGRRNFLNYEVIEEEDTYALSLVMDTLSAEGLAYPETAVFTCVDNEDGTFDFMTADGKYLTTPAGGAASGSATGISEYPTCFTMTKMYPNGKCELDVTYDNLFGLVALNNGGTFMAPNSSGSTFYTGTLPHFMSAWTSAMAIEVWTGEVAEGIESVVVENNAKGIYDLQGRKVENPTKGIYVVDGKKVLVK